MGDPRWGWLHGVGWTLLAMGGTLWFLLEIAGVPGQQGRVLRVIFAGLTLLGLVMLGVYFGVNPGRSPLDQVAMLMVC